jgi:RNA polymerase sigma-70 factor (ECF subfamily)
VADGGGAVVASLYPVEGREQVAQYFVELAKRADGLRLLERTVNGRPGLVAIHEGAPVAVYAFGIVDGLIQRIWAVRNPDKLRLWTEL